MGRSFEIPKEVLQLLMLFKKIWMSLIANQAKY